MADAFMCGCHGNFKNDTHPKKIPLRKMSEQLVKVLAPGSEISFQKIANKLMGSGLYPFLLYV